MLLQGVYGDFPHHNDGSHLDGGIADDATWQRCWRRLAAQSANWYATPSGAVGRRFTAILAAECRGVISQSWNSERLLVFAHVVLTKMLGVRRSWEIRARITRRMDPIGGHACTAASPGDLCNRSPGFGALVVQEETPSPLPVGCPTDGRPDLSQDNYLVEAPRYGLILLLTAEGGPALTGSPLCLGIPYQAHMLAPITEVHAPGDPCPDLPGLADAQRLSKNDVGEDEGSLGVPDP